MPSGSTVTITYDGTDITSGVLYNHATFESQMAAVPGTFSITVKDPNHTRSFVTGKKITLSIDGTLIWGGYVTQVTRQFAYPVDKTTNPAAAKMRQWLLQGVDYNILFDKLVVRNTADYVHAIPNWDATTPFGQLVKTLFSSYLDTPVGLNSTTYVDDYISLYDFNLKYDTLNLLTPEQAASAAAWVQQGSYARKQMETFAAFGAVYYIDAQFRLQFHSFETIAAPWGFSDKPNRLPLGSGGLTTIGMREFEVTEDAQQVVNEAFVWGGSDIAFDSGGTQGAIVVGHAENTASIAAHKRWQYSEFHPGEPNYMLQTSVDGRADVIVNGPEVGSSAFSDLSRGLANPVFSLQCVWFGHDVPSASHLVPGQVVTFILYTLGADTAHPLYVNLPLRSLHISFPNLDPTGKGYVRFEGQFAIQMSDQLWLWKYLRDLSVAQSGTIGATGTTTIQAINDTTVAAVLGSYVQQFPNELPDGSRRIFTLPQPYISGSLQVYVNGLLQTIGSSFGEYAPAEGSFELYFAPAADDVVWVICRVGA